MNNYFFCKDLDNSRMMLAYRKQTIENLTEGSSVLATYWLHRDLQRSSEKNVPLYALNTVESPLSI